MPNNDIWMRRNSRDQVDAAYVELGYVIALQAVKDLRFACQARHKAIRKHGFKTKAGLATIKECVEWLRSDACVNLCGHRFTDDELVRICNEAIDRSKAKIATIATRHAGGERDGVSL